MATLLIVDDNSDMNDLLRRTAERAGHQVLVARDGAEAVRVATMSNIDLVVLDLVMPGMDGIDALGPLRETGKAFRILAISGGGRVGAADYLRIARVLGADRTLAKPFTAQEFIRVVEDVLTEAHSPTGRRSSGLIPTRPPPTARTETSPPARALRWRKPAG